MTVIQKNRYPLYLGSSMRGVFTPGEKLETERVPFESLSVGDVVVILSADRPYVHRIVNIRPDGMVTMGDNNPVPDRKLFTADMEFAKVIYAVSLKGRRRRIAHGGAGMKLFRRNRIRRRIDMLISRLWQKIEPFAFWRLRASNKTIFGDEVHYHCGKIAVARRSADGKIIYHRKWKRLFFKVSVLLLSCFL